MAHQQTGPATFDRIVVALALIVAVAASAFGLVSDPPESVGAMEQFR
ncbi:hypothetical protein [Sphingomonas sp.]